MIYETLDQIENNHRINNFYKGNNYRDTSRQISLEKFFNKNDPEPKIF